VAGAGMLRPVRDVRRARLNPWLGPERGHLSDWTTQQWVRRTGRRIELRDEPWLDGPWAPPTGLRTDHTLRIWGRTFLRLHYAMQRV
jgi:hypothetical protein